MAVTAIWPIKARLDAVIAYAENPEKTARELLPEMAALHSVQKVVEYAAADMKTERGCFVTYLNCDPGQAARQFMETKEIWSEITGEDKTKGRACYHGYQSFAAGEVDARTAHAIGVRLAEELWGEAYQVVVATHLNTGHYHNHFVLNSVSLATGRKFRNSPQDYRRMRQVSDRLCREYRLSVIENPAGRGRSYREYADEKAGKPTVRGMIRHDIDLAISCSTTERRFFGILAEMGYEIKTHSSQGRPLRYPALRPTEAKGWFRFHTLGRGYALWEIKTRILGNIQKREPFPPEERRPTKQYRLRGKLEKVTKFGGLQGVFLRYDWELRKILRNPGYLHRVSQHLREDIIRLEKLDKQTRFLGKNRISTGEELQAHLDAVREKMDALTNQRRELRNELRRRARAGDEEQADALREQIADCSAQLKPLRQQMTMGQDILARSMAVRENLERIRRQREQEKQTRHKARDIGAR